MISLIEITDYRLTPNEIKAIRSDLGISQDELAKELKLTTVTISRWEQTKKDKKTGKIVPVKRISRDSQLRLLSFYELCLALDQGDERKVHEKRKENLNNVLESMSANEQAEAIADYYISLEPTHLTALSALIGNLQARETKV